jgi:hypothetical protein
MERYLQIEVFGHFFCVLGVLFDQITTLIGLSLLPTVYESNQIVALLMRKNVGLWFLLDVTILTILFIGIHFLFTFCYRKIQYRGFFLLLPSLIFGFLRIYCGVHNMELTLALA